MFPNGSEEFEHPHLAEPRYVIHDRRTLRLGSALGTTFLRICGGGLEESVYLAGDAFLIYGEFFLREQFSFRRPTSRVTDRAGSTTNLQVRSSSEPQSPMRGI